MFDCAALAIAVVTHNRPALVQATVTSALASVPTFRALQVIGNHPDDTAGVGRWLAGRGDPRCYFTPTGRPPEHRGRLAESWNLAMLWAFRDPAVEWLWCMHDDVTIVPHWIELLAKHTADLYAAPFGDKCFLFNRTVFAQVGWFDERYPNIAYQDNDWQMRVAWRLGEARVVIENKLPNLTWVTRNEIGLRHHWQPALRFDTKPEAKHGWGWHQTRWGATPDNWGKGIQSGPGVPDIEWYPWMTRGGAA